MHDSRVVKVMQNYQNNTHHWSCTLVYVALLNDLDVSFCCKNIKTASTSQPTVNDSTNDVILLGRSVSNLSVSVQGASVYATRVVLLPFIK